MFKTRRCNAIISFSRDSPKTVFEFTLILFPLCVFFLHIFHSTIHKMNHSRATHEKTLSSLCRICGEAASKTNYKKHYQKPYFINDELSNDLAFHFDIHVKTDSFHSKYVCLKCYRQICNGKKRKSLVTKQNIQDNFTKSKHMWQPFDKDIDEKSCHICVSMQKGDLALVDQTYPKL